MKIPSSSHRISAGGWCQDGIFENRSFKTVLAYY